MSVSPHSSIRDRLLIGAGFLIGASILSRILAIASISVLGRFLDPIDFGVIAYAWLIIELQRMLSGLPFVNALIRLPAIDQSHIDTVFTLCFFLNLILAMGLYLGADILAMAFGQAELAPVVAWLALVPAVDSIKNPRFALLARELRFNWPAAADVLARLATYSVSLPLAWLLKDYWSMIIGLITGAAVSSALTHYATPGPLRFGLQRWRDCVSFGAWTMAYRVTGIINRNLANLLLGRMLGLVSLGAFRMGSAVVKQIFDQLARPVDGLIFAGISKKKRSASELRQAYLDAQGLVFGFLLPLGAGVALCAPEFLRVLVGPQWGGAVPVLQILAPAMAMGLLGAGGRGILNALGDVRSIFLREILVLAFVLPAVWVGVSFFGVIGAVAATGLGELFGLLVVLPIIARRLQGSVFDGLLQGSRSIGSCLVMIAAVLGIAQFFGPVNMAQISLLDAAIMLFVKATFGSLVYTITHTALWYFAGRPRGTETIIFSILSRLRNRVRARLGYVNG